MNEEEIYKFFEINNKISKDKMKTLLISDNELEIDFYCDLRDK